MLEDSSGETFPSLHSCRRSTWAVSPSGPSQLLSERASIAEILRALAADLSAT
jgi:hypothetical protein